MSDEPIVRLVATTTGIGSAIGRAEQYLQRVTGALDGNAMAAADYAMEVTIDEMERSGGGHFWSGNRVESSTPGNYPAIQWGGLISSMETHTMPAPPDTGKAAFDAGGYGVPQAFYMEFGTSRHAPRPYMRTTTRKYRKEIMARLGARSSVVTHGELSRGAMKYY